MQRYLWTLGSLEDNAVVRKTAHKRITTRDGSKGGAYVTRYGARYLKSDLSHAPKELEAFTEAFRAGVRKARKPKSRAELPLFDPPLTETPRRKKARAA
jgi:hypothetical protein